MPHLGCPCRCSFCNQNTITGNQAPPTPDSVWELLQREGKRLGERTKEIEIAFFGGSFTAIDHGYMLSLLEPAWEAVKEFGFAGLRCSTRPDAIEEDTLELLKRYGMRAVELGAQSLCDEVLSKNHRSHTAAQVEQAAEMVKSAGLELGLQMMTGLDGDMPERAMDTARKMVGLKPDTVRIYPTLVLEGTELARRWKEGSYRPQTLEEAVSLCARLLPLFEAAGIAVIRVGLHPEREVESQLLAGPYHPAFKELVLSRGFLEKMTAAFLQRPEKEITFYVNSKDISAALGQKRMNIEILKKAGYSITICPREDVPRGELW